jgi:hypothetical protein
MPEGWQKNNLKNYSDECSNDSQTTLSNKSLRAKLSKYRLVTDRIERCCKMTTTTMELPTTERQKMMENVKIIK